MRSILIATWMILFAMLDRCDAQPPGILLILADDLNCCIGPYGDPTAKTPHLERLARRGVLFKHAYCQQAVCNPSRSSFLTGLRPDTIRVDNLRKYFRETTPNGSSLVTLPEHFKNHGYFCQNIGKLFHNMGDTQDRQSWSIDEILFKGTHAADTIHFNSPPRTRPKIDAKAPVTESEDVPDTAYRDGQIANLAASVIKEHPLDGQPLFLAVGFWRPHLPFVAPRKYWNLYDASRIPLPRVPDIPKDSPPIAIHGSREIKGYSHVPRDRPFTEQEVRHFRHGYYASISFLDAQVGKILDALDQSGHAKRTIVVFTSDHGFHTGQHSLWGKTSNFELDARVPLIIADPDKASTRGTSSDALVELVDLYPTLAGLTGVEADLPANLEGTSLVPIVSGERQSVKHVAFTQHQQPFYGASSNWKAWGYSVRTHRWRYTEWRNVSTRKVMNVELYDHETDPDESQNVAKAHPDTVSTLASELALQFGPFVESSDTPDN